MAFVQLLHLLLCFMASSFIHADEATDTNDQYVAIGPVENVTAYFTGSTNIVVAWDPAPVYLVHDVINASFDGITNGTEVIVSKHQSTAVLDHTNVTNESINSSNVTNESTNLSNVTSSVGDNADEYNVTKNVTSTTVLPTSSSIWKCRPLSFFNKFTVAVKEDVGGDDPSMVVPYDESIQQHDKQTVTIKDNQKLVLFSQGCTTSYEILWKSVEPGSPDFNMSVPQTNRTANITGLTPNTTYQIVIKAVYASGDSFENKPPLSITTKKIDEPKVCSCDMYGTISPNQGCQVNGSTYCKCKNGYYGNFCEMCSPGYYRTATHFPCHPCPCDAHASRKSTCQFVEGFLRCDTCEVGYTGNTCHMCDKGFYRVNRHCVPCMCNGNTPPRTQYMCLSTIGSCLNCQYNTTGFHCERCLPGYVGDPIVFKNCTRKDEVVARSLKAESSSVPPGVVAAITITFLLSILLVVALLLFRRYYSREKRRAFWTVEMKRDSDDVGFNSVHNDDAHLDDTDDIDYFSKHGISSSSNKYSRLQEDI